MSNGTWRHQSALDVDLYVTRVQSGGPGLLIINGILWCRVHKRIYEIGEYKILRSELHKWSRVNE